MASEGETTAEAPARAGLAGNPSDALGGAALAVPVASLSARVVLRPADRFSVRGPADEASWPTMGALEAHARQFGHEGADRLVTAALVTLWRHRREAGGAGGADGVLLDGDPFEVEWSTSIPRSVGLAGSSALVVATLRAAASRWGLDVAPATVAALALHAERDELGIGAGWMDRAVQAHGVAVLVDATAVAAGEPPAMRVVAPPHDVDLVLAWDPAGAAPSGRLHGSLRARLADGDPTLVAAVGELVAAAHDATAALTAGDLAALAAAVDRSCELRRRLGALDATTAALVEIARGAGGSATSAGSGGAVTVVAPPERLDAIEQAFRAAGSSTTRVRVG